MVIEGMFQPLRDWLKAHRNTKPATAAAPPPPTTTAAPPADSPVDPTIAEWPRPNLPRLYISGRFYNDPPTINNLVDYYNTARFRPTYQLTTDEINFNGAFCPKGTGTFAFVDCQVQASYSPKTFFTPSDTNESLIGKTIAYNGRSVYGKLVDLDPQFQDVFTLYGARIIIGDGDGSFTALLEPAPSRDWWDAIDNPDKDGKAYNKGASATFQGVLKVESFNPGTSTFLNECQQYMTPDGDYLGTLSMRFRTDSYSNDYDAADFCYGNLTAFITPWIDGYPTSFDAARRLEPTDNANQVLVQDEPSVQIANRVVARLEKNPNTNSHPYTLYLDLVNALYRKQSKGHKEDEDIWIPPYEDLGALTVKAGSASYGSISYMSEWFDQASCVVDIPLTADEFNVTKETPLQIHSEKYGIILQENSDGLVASADKYLYRIEPDGGAQYAQIYVSRFGRLQKDVPVHVGLDSTLMQTNGQRQGGGPVVGTPVSALCINNFVPTEETADTFQTTLNTNENGFAHLFIAGTDPGNPRGYIDGQVYGLRYSCRTPLPPPSDTVIGNDKINILLFNYFIEPKNRTPNRDPTWLVDILPIFQQYANLYPSMDRVVRLDDYSSVLSRREALLRVFTADEDSGEYMPTKRDLSAPKKSMIVDWLNNGAPYMLQTEEDLYKALQAAVEIEHSTMPPYLTALYSIKPGYNTYVANTLREVAMEEMLHMAISCNILISLGQAPVLNNMGIVPKFPGPLPGGVCEDLIVRLRKCSKEQINVFQRIETPDNVYITEDGDAAVDDNFDENKMTIGTIYTTISRTITKLHHDGVIKFPNECDDDEKKKRIENQVTGPFAGKLRVIYSRQDATDLINLIKDQGEGKQDLNPTDDDTGNELAHYFRFAEIVRGRRLTFERDPETNAVTSYAFNGPPIVINPEGVYNMQDDPKIELQPLGSQQRDRMNSFARKYEGLLKGLHIAFNGQPSYFEKCYGLMFQLTMAAQPLMEMPALDEDGHPKKDGTTCGISFQMPIDEIYTYHAEGTHKLLDGKKGTCDGS